MFTFQYFHIPRTLSRSYCTRALQALEKVIKKPQQGIINLIVIDVDTMARMNKQFRGKDGPTDILTFSYLEKMKNDGRSDLLIKDFTSRSQAHLAGMTETIAGEIYLCLEKIKLYAKERGTTYKEQLEYIVIHGLTHLMGYDHETEKDTLEMEALEKKILKFLV